MIRRLLAAALVTVLGACAIGSVTAEVAVADGPPTVSVSPVKGEPGSTLDVSGTLWGQAGCTGAGTVGLYDGAKVLTSVPLTRISDGATSTYSTRLGVPAGTDPGVLSVTVLQDGCSDGTNASATTPFEVVPGPPVAHDTNVVTPHDTPVSIDLSNLVTGGDTIGGYLIDTRPGHGTVSSDGGPVVTYTPSQGFVGADSFSWHACEFGETGRCSNVATVFITVTPPVVTVRPDLGPAVACAGDTVRPQVTVLQDGKPLAGATATFTSTMSGQDPIVLSAETGGDGVAATSYSRGAPGEEQLSVVVSGAPAVAPLARTWQSCTVEVSLAPDGESGEVGSSFDETATVAYRNAPAAGSVTFVPTSAGTDGDPVVVPLDASGRASTTFTCSATGAVTITASAAVDGRTGTATATHTCAAVQPSSPPPVSGTATPPPPPPPPPPAHALALALAPSGTESLVGQPATYMAVLSTDGAPVVGAPVDFTAALPGQPPATGHGVTNADGSTSFTMSRAVAGTDTVTARAVRDGQDVTAKVLHFWRAVPGLTVTLTPDGQASEVDLPWTASVVATLNGRPARGAAVRFSAAGAGQEAVRGAATTDVRGAASFTVTRAVAGLDTVSAEVSLTDGRHGSASVSHLWRQAGKVAPVPPTLSTDRADTPPGGPVTVSGARCPPRAPVTVRVAKAQLAVVAADAAGRYRSVLRTPDLRAGRYTLTATCGGRSASARLDLVVQSSSTGTSGSAVTTTASVLTFFVLLGGQLLRPSAAALLNTPTG